ncbi:MAG: Hint domain-containing protein [Pseudomonadota bacterium]
MFDLMDTAHSGLEIDLDSQFGVTRRSGLLHSTRVATRVGSDVTWREVEALAVGDEVLTFDNGFQRITAVERVVNWPDHKTCPDHAAPFEVPAGVLGNRELIWMLPNQLVVVESDRAEELTGDPFALVPVDVLEGWKGIQRVAPRAPHLVVILHFAEDQVIYAGDGALVFCQAEGEMLDHAFEAPAYDALDRPVAHAVADSLRAAEAATFA